MTSPTFECNVHFRRCGRGSRREMIVGQEPPRPTREPGRIPRVARLMALAIRFEEYVRAGQLASHSELADLGHVSRPRISQIMNLLNLAPDIQEAILFLPRTIHGRDLIRLSQLQPIAKEQIWTTQRHMWQKITEVYRLT